MNRGPASRVAVFRLSLGASFFVLAAGLPLRAQESAKVPGDAPVRQELEEFRARSSKTATPDRLASL